MLKNVNNKKYRNQRCVLKHIHPNQNFSSPTILSPKQLFLKPKVISFYSTGSDSIVYKIMLRRSKRCIIVKISPHIHTSFHETFMYSIVNMMIKRNITPHVIKYYNINNNNFYRNTAHPSIKKHINFEHGILLATETYTSNIQTLQKSILTYPLEVFFQVLYTLACFQRIGFAQNDLHHSNIFVVKLKGKENYYNKYIFTTKNKKTKHFYIPTKCEHVRIFDFDRGISTYTKGVHSSLQVSRKYATDSKNILGASFGKMYQYYDKKRDLIRFLLPYLKTQSRFKEHNLAIQLFNLNNNGDLRTGIPKYIKNISSKQYLPYDYFVHKHSQKPITISDKILPSISQMLMSDVFKSLTQLPKGGKVLTTYNISNVY